MTVDTTSIIDQGRTRQVTYKAAVVFVVPSEMKAIHANEVKALVDPFFVSEVEAGAVKTKTVSSS